MPSEKKRWTEGALRNTVGGPSGPTGAIEGGVDGHAKAYPNETESIDRVLRAAEPKEAHTAPSPGES